MPKTSHKTTSTLTNAARAAVGVEPITWDNTVAAYAQSYVNQSIADCSLVHSGGPFHISNRSYGENLAWSSGDLSGTDAVTVWVNEGADYDYVSNSCASGKVCRRYTQVVWRNSVRLGCAKVTCNNGGTFITLQAMSLVKNRTKKLIFIEDLPK
ncbi:pathogenesis-related protein 1-like [Hibiscus syriacus]|uniref:pathogenesis-related protein 1-like n=1 Tax=Hibiscus syriacus TaxID=106335 RepID=UPI00192178E4|nr:pathogenesis-related protein 1-like [Hibiscus syriacus]